MQTYIITSHSETKALDMGIRYSRISGESQGFEGDTVFILEDGSAYRQTEYYYRYRYKYRPKVTIINNRQIIIEGIDKAVRVERLR